MSQLSRDTIVKRAHRTALGKIDQRYRGARLHSAVQRDLLAAIGPEPTLWQRSIATCCADVELALAHLRTRMAAGRSLDRAAQDQLIRLSNSKARLITMLASSSGTESDGYDD
jgi:hypothetical protein